MRTKSIHALGLRRDLRGKDALVAALDDPTAQVRGAAANSLGWLRDDPKVRERLEELAKTDRAAEVRDAAVAALTAADPRVKVRP